MGKIEAAGSEFAKINELDEEYAKKIVKIMERINKKTLSWKNHFKLGFCYYFIYEELHGRMELAKRRIKRAKKSGDNEKLTREKQVIENITPTANIYKDNAIYYFRLVARKEPKDYYNAWGYTYMSVIKGIAKEWADAKKYSEKAIKILPDAYAIRAAYMETLRQNGNHLAATGQMASALKLKADQDKYEKELFGDEYYLE